MYKLPYWSYWTHFRQTIHFDGRCTFWWSKWKFRWKMYIYVGQERVGGEIFYIWEKYVKKYSWRGNTLHCSAFDRGKCISMAAHLATITTFRRCQLFGKQTIWEESFPIISGKASICQSPYFSPSSHQITLVDSVYLSNSQMYLPKYQNVFVQISKCILPCSHLVNPHSPIIFSFTSSIFFCSFPRWSFYFLSPTFTKYQNVFVQIVICICPIFLYVFVRIFLLISSLIILLPLTGLHLPTFNLESNFAGG